MKLDLDYGTIEGIRPPPKHAVNNADIRQPAGGRRGRLECEYTAPTHLIVKCTIRMPIEGDDAEELLQGKLKGVLYASEFMKAEDVPEIVIARPSEQNMLNRYVYLAWYRLTDESIARIQRQRPLFE